MSKSSKPRTACGTVLLACVLFQIVGCGGSDSSAVTSFEALVKQVEEQLPAAFAKELAPGDDGYWYREIKLKEPISFDVQSTPSLPSPYHATLSALILKNAATGADSAWAGTLFAGFDFAEEHRWEITYAYENGSWKSKEVFWSDETKYVSGNRSDFEEMVSEYGAVNDGQWTVESVPEFRRDDPIMGVLLDPYRRTLASGSSE